MGASLVGYGIRAFKDLKVERGGAPPGIMKGKAWIISKDLTSARAVLGDVAKLELLGSGREHPKS